jgi:hypothetical protein
MTRGRPSARRRASGRGERVVAGPELGRAKLMPRRFAPAAADVSSGQASRDWFRQYVIFCGSLLASSTQRLTSFSEGRKRTSFRFLLASAMDLASLAGLR